MTREELERDQQNIQAELEEADETLAPHPFGSAGVRRAVLGQTGVHVGAQILQQHRAV